MNRLKHEGFSLLEILLVLFLLSFYFIISSGLSRVDINRAGYQSEANYLIDNLRWAQRKAILTGREQYFSIDISLNTYYFYELIHDEINIHNQISLSYFTYITINRSIDDKFLTFYFSPSGAPVFGCTITLKDDYHTWKVIIAVASGKVRLEKD